MAFSMPGFDPNDNEPIIYDVSYNINLRNKLEADYDKKYTKKIDDYHYVDTAPLNAYYWEVQVPYDLNKKPDNYKIISH
jgi:hypothetical protein